MEHSTAERKKRVRAKNLYRKRSIDLKGLSLPNKFFIFSLVSILILSISGLFAFNYFYYKYENVILTRKSSGFWQSRAGIYSASRNISVGQKIGKSELVQLLRRAGYVEDNTADKFWNGNFVSEENQIKITTNDRSKTQTADIRFKNDKIIEIENKTGVIKSFKIKPEMLTGRSETKRAGNQVLKYEQIPENLKNAIIYTEDRRFFDHFGIDPKGILRAFWANVTEKRIVQGGSTLTQQLVKNTFLSNKRTFQRKFSEAFLAMALENNISKEDIFTLYCNEVYLGQYGITGIHGFNQASRAYFDKNINQLNLAEATTLAAMIQSPNRFSLGKNSKALKQRRNLIIRIMQKEGVISSDEAESASSSNLTFTKPKAQKDAIAPYFVDSVIKDLENKTTEDSQDDDNLRIYTTLDTNLQAIAENSVTKHIDKLEKTLNSSRELQPQATLIAMDPQTGHVLAMVGGNDYSETQFNRATQAKRQPGSTFKPFVYATAIERGIMPTKIYADKPATFNFVNSKPYKPSNYGNHYAMKEITMKTALAKSSNVISVEVSLASGLDRVAAKSAEFGFEDVQPYPSTALGTSEVSPIQLAAAYSSFANLGRKVDPVFINQINSGDGGAVYQNNPVSKQIISDETAFMITDMLQAVVERGTARSAKNSLGKNVAFAGKTGSSNDGWFVGYTPNLVCVVWVGYDENEDIKSTGGEIALPLWVDFMKQVIDQRPELGGASFTMPQNLTAVKIDPETGMLAGKMCPMVEEVVIPKSELSNISCLKHQQLQEIYVAETEIDIIEPEVLINETSEIIDETEIGGTQVETGKTNNARTHNSVVVKNTLKTVPKLKNKKRLEPRRNVNKGKPLSDKISEVRPNTISNLATESKLNNSAL